MKELVVRLIKGVLGRWEWTSQKPKYGKKDLLVLCYHSTPQHFMHRFEAQYNWYIDQGFTFLSPEELPDFYEGKLSEGPYLLYTFDDGLKNNLLAARFLQSKGVKAFFFLVPAFYKTPASDQADYYQRVIRPVINPKWEPLHERGAMSMDKHQELMALGHSVGAHTYTHALEASEKDEKELIKEVVGSKEGIQADLRTQINTFCSINQTDWSLNPTSARLVRENYTYHFTTFPGVNQPTDDPLFIYRRNVEVFWGQGMVKFAMGKRDLSRWKERIEACRASLGFNQP